MINLSLQVQPAAAADHAQIAALMNLDAGLHRHLDWRSPLEWLGAPNFWILSDGARVLAAFACPEDPPGVAWIRLFAHAPQISAAEAWDAIWKSICILPTNAQVAAIVVRPWFEDLLRASQFEVREYIALLELKHEEVRNFGTPAGIEIRVMREADLNATCILDVESFGSFWHNSAETLSRARRQAVYASVAHAAGEIVGYQISTGTPLGAHLARLAISPKFQGRGIGAALVSDLLRRLGPNDLPRLSVNTQEHNAASLKLYKKLGFVRTGEQFPVLIHARGRGSHEA